LRADYEIWRAVADPWGSLRYGSEFNQKES